MTSRIQSIAAFLLFCAWSGGVSGIRAEEVQVVKSGKYYGAVEAYQAGEHFYLGAKEAAEIYGGQRYWFAVRGQVQLSFRGKQVRLRKDSDEALVDGRAVRLARPMLVRAGLEFIPIELFTAEEFADATGLDSKFNPETRLLLVNQRSSVGALRWFTYSDHTRVVLDIKDDLRYKTSRRGLRGFDVTIPNGAIDWSEKTDISDGVIEFIHLSQEAKQARLTIKLEAGATGVDVREFQSPRRIVIDVGRSVDSAEAARLVRGALEAPPVPGAAKNSPKARKAPPVAAAPGAGVLPSPGAEAERNSRAASAPSASGLEPGTAGIEGSGAAPVMAADESGKFTKYRIIIDAGHGGKDGGAVGRGGTLEKSINIDAAKELARLLEEEGLFDVRLTRSEDSFVGLDERIRIADEYGADLFISLHSNANPSRRESGFEVYFLSERASDPEAERLAEFENAVLALEGKSSVDDGAAGVLFALAKTEFINDAAELAGLMTRSLAQRVDLPNRGVKQAAFYVLRGANAPAVLVEMGFLSNSRDEAKLQSGKYRRKIVEGLYAGIVEFAKRKGWTSSVGRGGGG